jgi:hypothetical protein
MSLDGRRENAVHLFADLQYRFESCPNLCRCRLFMDREGKSVLIQIEINHSRISQKVRITADSALGPQRTGSGYERVFITITKDEAARKVKKA